MTTNTQAGINDHLFPVVTKAEYHPDMDTPRISGIIDYGKVRLAAAAAVAVKLDYKIDLVATRLIAVVIHGNATDVVAVASHVIQPIFIGIRISQDD